MKRKNFIVCSILTIAMCVSMIAGATFALFTSESKVNIAVTSGKVDVKASVENFEYKTLTQDWTVVNDSKTEFDGLGGSAVLDGDVLTLDKIVPGDAVKFDVKITNNSNVTVKYRTAVRNLSDDLTLFNVLDVSVNDEDFSSSKISSWAVLDPSVSDVETISVVIELPETAEGQELMGKTSTILVSVEAIQGNAETSDDALAGTFNEFVNALNSGKPVTLTNDIIVPETINVYSENETIDAVVNGNGFEIKREDGYTGNIFTVKAGNSLTLNDVIIDGGAIWEEPVTTFSLRASGSETSSYGVQNKVNNGVTSTAALIIAEGNAKIVLGEDVLIENNDGSCVVNLGTRIGATLEINGAQIINNKNNTGEGVIWGGGHITMNSGKLNGNYSTSSSGVIRMVSNCNFTMNGGEIMYNVAETSGGVIWGYGSSTYNLSGGVMSYNQAATAGAIYTGEGSVINISGDFRLENNTADDAGALRLSNRTTLNMSGGVISGNESFNSPNWDGFYGWNPALNLTGGTIEDAVTIQGGLTPTIGEGVVTGVIYFDLSTNHNTCNLKAEFGNIRFYVTEDDNFEAFNFKPAEGYVYSEEDLAKLVCLNEGYSTYWDATTGTFRLQAK